MRNMVLVAAAAMMVAGSAQAGEWEFIVNPYFMAPKMNGKASIGEFDTRVDQSPADIFSNLNWGVMGDVEVNNGNWGVNIDANYMNLNVSDPDRRQFRTTGSQGAYTATLLKRVSEEAWVYAGVRYSDIAVRFRCDFECSLPGVPGAPRDIDVSRNQDWVEGLVGVRVNLAFNEQFDLTFNGDVGGFGEGSDISVNVWPQIGCRMSEGAKLMLGYRIIYVKYENEDAGRRFVYDVSTVGPTLGVEFRF